MLKLKTIQKSFLYPFKKGRSQCYTSLYCEEYGNIYNTGKIIYKQWSKPCDRALLQLENKQQIMQNNVETQHKYMYSLYIDSLCIIDLSMARFTCIVTLQVFLKI